MPALTRCLPSHSSSNPPWSSHYTLFSNPKCSCSCYSGRSSHISSPRNGKPALSSPLMILFFSAATTNNIHSINNNNYNNTIDKQQQFPRSTAAPASISLFFFFLSLSSWDAPPDCKLLLLPSGALTAWFKRVRWRCSYFRDHFFLAWLALSSSVQIRFFSWWRVEKMLTTLTYCRISRLCHARAFVRMCCARAACVRLCVGHFIYKYTLVRTILFLYL